MSRLWSVLADPDGGVDRLARGTVVWDLVLFEPGLPVVVEAHGEMRVLHAGGAWCGVPLPVPAKLAPELRAAWLAGGIGATLYRTEAGFERAIARRRARAAALREAGLAWARLDALRTLRDVTLSIAGPTP